MKIAYVTNNYCPPKGGAEEKKTGKNAKTTEKENVKV